MKCFCILFLASLIFVPINVVGIARSDSVPTSDQLRRQLDDYVKAELDLLRSEQAVEVDNQQCIFVLEYLDRTNRDSWRALLGRSADIYRRRARYISDLQTLLSKETQVRDPSMLRYLIEHNPDGARARYRKQREMAKENDRLNRSLRETVQAYRRERLGRLGEWAT